MPDHKRYYLQGVPEGKQVKLASKKAVQVSNTMEIAVLVICAEI